MSIHYQTQGVFIKKVDRGEADQVFTIYTKDYGKLEILGKAIRKIKSKLRSGAELFYLSEIEFIQGKAHKTLTDAVLIDNFRNIRNNLQKLAVAFKISQALDALIKEQEQDKEIWHLLNECFRELDNWKNQGWKLKIIYYYFFWNLISILGYQPELYHCLICQKRIIPEKIYFGPEQGGIICRNCGHNLPRQAQKLEKTKVVQEISLNVIKILRIFLSKDLPLIKKLKIEDKDQELLKKISKVDFYKLL